MKAIWNIIEPEQTGIFFVMKQRMAHIIADFIRQR